MQHSQRQPQWRRRRLGLVMMSLVTCSVTLWCPGSALKTKLIDQIAMESDISEGTHAVAVLPPPSFTAINAYQAAAPAVFSGFKINPNCKCGVSPYRDKSGNPHPWTAAVFYKQPAEVLEDASQYPLPSKSTLLLFCTGSLINDRYVLTASRCVQGLNVTDLQVWLSPKRLWSDQVVSTSETYRANDDDGTLQKFAVDRVVVHPEFDVSIHNHEIALLKLSEPVKLPSRSTSSSSKKRRKNRRDSSMRMTFTPVCLPKRDIIDELMAENDGGASEAETYISNFRGSVVGWEKKGRTSYSLVQSQVPLVNGMEKCAEMMGNQTAEVNDNMICAGNIEQGANDSCSMDTGSPLVIREASPSIRRAKTKSSQRRRGDLSEESKSHHYTLVGVSSWLYGCTNLDNVRLLYDVIFPNNTAKPQVPGVYTRVERYRNWITHNTLDAVWCA